MNKQVYAIKKCFCLFACGLCFILFSLMIVNSSTWYRFKVAKAYMANNEIRKGMQMFIKISRKEMLFSRNPSAAFLKSKIDTVYDVNRLLAQYYLSKNNKLEAIKYFNKLKDIRPLDKSNYERLFKLYIDFDNINEAANIVAQYKLHTKDTFPIKLPEDEKWYYKLGLSCIDKKMWIEAKDAFQKCLNKNQYFADAYYQLGNIYQKLDNPNDAYKQYHFALENAPGHIEALKKICQIEIALSNNEKVKKIKKAIEDLTPTIEWYVNYSNKIEILGYNISMYDANLVEVIFWLRCIGNLEDDYRLWVTAIPKNKKNERLNYPESVENVGLASLFIQPTSSWKIGEVYRHQYTKRIIPGGYDIRLGLVSTSQNKLINISTRKRVSFLNNLIIDRVK